MPLRLNEGGAPPPSNMVLLAECWNRRINRHGYYEARPFRYTRDQDHRLFNYGGGFNLVSRRQSEVDAGAAALSPDELIWLSDYNYAPRAAHAGNWAFAGEAEYKVHVPWYKQWRSRNWFHGLN